MRRCDRDGLRTPDRRTGGTQRVEAEARFLATEVALEWLARDVTVDS